MRIHCIRHEPFEGLAGIEGWINKHNHKLTITHAYLNQCFPSDIVFDMLIIMGGTGSICEPESIPYIREELSFINKCIKKDIKILGICLGAQILAHVLGAKVYPAKKEIGWFPVEFCLNGDSSLSFLPKTLKVFHWHGDTFDIPEGAERLGSSEVTPNQGFIYGNNIVALQFHLEMTSISLEKIIRGGRKEIEKGGSFVQSAEQIKKQVDSLKENNKLMFDILEHLSNS